MNRLGLPLVLAASLVIGLAWLGSIRSGPKAQGAVLVSYTNGFIGAIAPVFPTLGTNHAATYRRWLAGGTNGAVFRLTNQQSCAIWIYPIAWLSGADPRQPAEETPVLNAPSFSGLRLERGEIAEVQVAVPSQAGDWKLRLQYHRDLCTDTFFNRAKFLPASLRSAISGQSMEVPSFPIESEWVRPIGSEPPARSR